jgi:hypothetical protein
MRLANPVEYLSNAGIPKADRERIEFWQKKREAEAAEREAKDPVVIRRKEMEGWYTQLLGHPDLHITADRLYLVGERDYPNTLHTWVEGLGVVQPGWEGVIEAVQAPGESKGEFMRQALKFKHAEVTAYDRLTVARGSDLPVMFANLDRALDALRAWVESIAFDYQ